jgi:hypothetical protein
VVQDEDVQEKWLTNGVPDEPSEEDLEFIAKDAEDFGRVARLFGKLLWYDNM